MMTANDELRADNARIRGVLANGVQDQLTAIPGVVHVSVGLKETGGRVTDELCIRVYVEQKRDPASLPAAELVPARIHGSPTDVNTIGAVTFTTNDTRYRPIKGGIQITNRIIDVNSSGTGTQMHRGTLGCTAIDNTDRAPVLLTNWHVLSWNGGRVADPVFQPGPATLPSLSLADLPYHPPDDTDKIGVIRRMVVGAKVDGGIAAIDVSSWCNCCGIRSTNEIDGLSVGGRPPRNTIVGDEPAVSGMTVFKVGQSTLRTEGRVVDDNYPSFDIDRDGTTYTFTGQIAVSNTDPAKPFSDHGDSGAALVNLDNKIVGLMFAAGRNVPLNNVQQPFLSLANHISDVLSALNIRIPYSPNVVTVAGETLTDLRSRDSTASIPEPYRRLQERLQRHDRTADLLAIVQRHSEEVIDLVNHCRRVTVAWHRSQGPALLAGLMRGVRDGHERIPAAVNGYTAGRALERMVTVLSQHGSPELAEALQNPEVGRLILAFEECPDLSGIIARLSEPEPAAPSLGGARS